MKNTSQPDPSIYKRVSELTRIFKKAVYEARMANRKAGLPNVYSLNGNLYYELPDGTITTENPFADDHSKKSEQE